MVVKTRTRNETIIDPQTSPYAGVGLVWEIKGSKGDTYKVTLESFGFRCSCMGYQIRRDCKHCNQIDQLLGGDHEDPVYDINFKRS
jgi:hypothetical protein